MYTEEQIKKFEQDVLNGREIDINTYIDNSKPDYSNAFSDFGEDLSNLIDYGADKSMNVLENFFEILFE